DKDIILSSKTWSFDGQYLLLKNWNPGNLEFHEEELCIRIWVQVWNLPLHWMSMEAGAKIGQKIGKVINVVMPGAGSAKGQLIKILAELNLKEPIPRGTNLKVGSENRWVEFRYESIQTFCFYCGLIGHSDRNCQLKKDDLKRNVLNVGQYGEWLRTTHINLGDGRNSYSKNADSQAGEPENHHWAVFVYASINVLDRKCQWNSLVRYSMSWGTSWFFGRGDFNDILSNSEKKGGALRDEASFENFRGMVRDIGAVEPRFIGHPFTWSNNRKGQDFIEVKLDRFLISPDWMVNFPDVLIKHIPLISSNHSMIMMDTLGTFGTPKHMFIFDGRWTNLEGYKEIIEDALQERLKNIKRALIRWKA
ncbi:Unknown protein, partial [Striga hermonthica]